MYSLSSSYRETKYHDSSMFRQEEWEKKKELAWQIKHRGFELIIESLAATSQQSETEITAFAIEFVHSSESDLARKFQ